MGYREVIASAIGESEGGGPNDYWNTETADKVLQHLTEAGFAIVPISMPESMFSALLDDWEAHASIAGGQGYRDIWSVALKSAKALA